MHGFFHPNNIAVVGVSESEDNLGRRISANLQSFSFHGIIYEVGPRGGTLFGRRIHRSVSDIPDHIDLAVILTPAATVPGILEECGQKGIRWAVVESSGFREYGPEGKDLEARLRQIAGQYGIRFIGPNCIGVVNRHNGLSTPFVLLDPSIRAGGISLITQSGGVGISELNMLSSEGLGLAKMMSVGNKLDVDENDLLEYLMTDPETDVIIMYLEGIRDGRRLMDLAKRSTKPILVHKSNIGEAAHGIASSHTAALSANDAVVDAALRQAGIARFRDSETLVLYLKALTMPSLNGNRLAVLSRSGGHAVIAADECELTGFEMAKLPVEFLDQVQKLLRANVIRLTNPIDLGDLFDLDAYADLAERTLSMDCVDGMIFMHTYMTQHEGEQSEELFRRLHALTRRVGKPVGIYAAAEAGEVSRLKRTLDGPIFSEPSDAVRSLALQRDFRHLAVRERFRPDGPADQGRVRAVLEACRSAGRHPLLSEAMSIAEAYGVPVLPARLVGSADAAVEAARTLGYPVAIKVVSPSVSHKSDIGGVQLNLRGDDAVRSAYKDMMTSLARQAPDAAIEGVLVQPMASSGRELIVGANWDRNFGHTVLVGLGGIFVEVFRDTAMRVAPFGADTVQDMLRQLRVYPLLEGARGEEPADIPALTEVVLAVCRLVTDVPEIVELDLNPVRVFPSGHGCAALDARITLAPPATAAAAC
jgi:acyl-CoA synthetase (NDP forming)